MRTRRIWALPLVILALAGVASGNDSWRNKPFSQWSEKEVRQILENSPWAHRIRMLVVKPGTQGGACPSGKPPCSQDSFPPVNSSPTEHRSTMTAGDIQAVRDIRTASPTLPPVASVEGTAVVRWASSRTVREAIFRNRVQRGLIKPGDSQQSGIFAPPDVYIVYVDLRVSLEDVKKVPQSGLFTAAMVQNSILILKSTGERISPLAVKTAPLPEFDERKEIAIGAFYVFFPRIVAGKSTLPGNESLVRFECPIASGTISFEFEPAKMEREGLPDL
ncbi:MAG TPA: hypothetical protein VEG63_11035 [Candidatus Acidoferrales bacterium]|nr:hypothetical protein [Candidatus Acidoferrales bacterium]